jgi:hypothetical protein
VALSAAVARFGSAAGASGDSGSSSSRFGSVANAFCGSASMSVGSVVALGALQTRSVALARAPATSAGPHWKTNGVIKERGER